MTRDHYEAEAKTHVEPGAEVCDFCNARLNGTVWTYRTEPHEMAAIISDGGPALPPNAVVTRAPDDPTGRWTTHCMDGDGFWAACSPCHLLIDRGDRRGLVRRALNRALAMESGRVTPDEFRFMASLIAGAHESFFRHRKPDPAWRGTADNRGAP